MIDVDEISQIFNLDVEKIINVYRYGSHVYDTTNELSDEDYIIVYIQENQKYEINLLKHQATVYSSDEFSKQILEHEISVLECLFLPDEFKYVTKKYDFVLDSFKLRKSVSTKSSNSFVKAKKKMIQGDYYIGKKSLLHSIRILNFGIQIAKNKKIIDYRCDFKNIFSNIINLDDWETMNKIFKPIYNKIHTEFKKLTNK